MQQLSRKICLFLFLIAVLSGRANELGTLVGAITGTLLLWPLYERLTTGRSAGRSQRVAAEEEREEVASR
ncbi:MAG TPA: hypothetical protein DCY80_04495 [Solibacterales bacterium]|jgi:hypothetical protein|nr:hypothetical protein [Bryobacterales bacterium]